jgi:hypothetical protein
VTGRIHFGYGRENSVTVRDRAHGIAAPGECRDCLHPIRDRRGYTHTPLGSKTCTCRICGRVCSDD